MKQHYFPDVRAGSRVLIIDDEVDMCLLMKAYFLRKGCKVFITHMPDDGLLAAAEHKPDFVFIEPRWYSMADEIAEKIVAVAPDVKMVLCYGDVFYPFPDKEPPTLLTEIQDLWRSLKKTIQNLKKK